MKTKKLKHQIAIVTGKEQVGDWLHVSVLRVWPDGERVRQTLIFSEDVARRKTVEEMVELVTRCFVLGLE